jgi:hypothetical protein
MKSADRVSADMKFIRVISQTTQQQQQENLRAG